MGEPLHPQRRTHPTARARCRISTWPARTASAPRRNSTSKVWFTVANGVLSDVYYPTIDNTNNETLQFVVTDGSHLHRPADPRHDLPVSALDDSGMSCRVTTTAKNGRYTLVTDYFTDPQRDSVVMRTTLAGRARATRRLALRPVRRRRSTATAVAVTGERRRRQRGHRHQHRITGAGRRSTPSTTTNAANRDYAHARLRGAARRPAVPGRVAAASPAPPAMD